MRMTLLAFAVAVAVLACGGGDDDEAAPVGTAATAAPTAPGHIPAVSDFARVEDAQGLAVWHLGAPAEGVPVGPLCSALGGGSELAVSGRTSVESRTLGGRFIGTTRQGVWVLWLSEAATRAIPLGPQPGVSEGQLVARLNDRMTVEPSSAYLRCN